LREHRVVVRTIAVGGVEELFAEDAQSLSSIPETNAEDIREPVQAEVGIP
jgi:hypothetical protein